MSEYQYYEFQAIDRALSADQVDKLRSYSTRAQITSTTFTNEYSWGSFKGNPDAWMEKYFDAFVYLANWGTHILKLRLSSSLLGAGSAKKYLGGAWVKEKLGKVVLSFVSEDEEGDGDWVEGQGHLSSMISVRADLARGDWRALYLGWLMRAQAGELADQTVEPPVPPGLGKLTASLDAMAEFLRIDRDLIDVAAQTSRPMNEMSTTPAEVHTWVAGLSAKQKDDLLANLIVDGDHSAAVGLFQKFLKESGRNEKNSAGSRTVRDLLKAAQQRSEERQQAEAELRAKATARRDRQAAIAREKHLNGLAGQQDNLWTKVNALLHTKRQPEFAQAAAILVDLRDLAGAAGSADFGLRIAELRRMHPRKRTFLDMLAKAGL
jgi:hypothetical protein